MNSQVTDFYERISSVTDQKAVMREHCFHGLTAEEESAAKTKGMEVYRGKVRDLLIGSSEIRMLHTDRLTAFDRFIDYVPYKGVMLTDICTYWFSKFKDVVPTHFIETTSPRELRVHRTDPVRVEVVVRAYLAGNIARIYEAGERHYCGVNLPDGLIPYGKLETPIITPTTKAVAFAHDEVTTAEAVVQSGVCTQREWDEIRAMALDIFEFGRRDLAKRDWLLADTKYEFGRMPNGKIVLIDEVHTPDSSRFWRQKSYAERLAKGHAPEMLDKQVVRKWLIEHGFSGVGDVPEVPAGVLLALAQVYLEVVAALS